MQILYENEAVWNEVYMDNSLSCATRESMGFLIVPITESTIDGSYGLDRVISIKSYPERVDLYVPLFPLW